MKIAKRSISFFALRKYLRSIPLVLFLCSPFVCAQENVIEMTNADVLSMVRAKVPAVSIIEKIQTSSCHFDTFPTVISELRYKGVPEDVLVAMVEAPIGRPKQGPGRNTTKVELVPVASTRVENKQQNAPKSRSAEMSPVAAPPKNLKSVVKAEESVGEISVGKAATQLKSKSTTTAQLQAQNTESTTAPTSELVSSTVKKDGPDISATLPLPQPARPEKGITLNLTMPAGSQLLSPELTMPAPPESRVAIDSKPANAGPQVLTNSDIIKLLHGGTPLPGVVTVIKASPGNYDLSAKALLQLREAGADATVFLSMMEINQRTSTSDTSKKKND